MVLVDTSVWIEVFRRPRGLDLEKLVALEEVVTCLPIYQEVLQGFRDEWAFRVARQSFAAMPIIESPMGRSLFDDAVEIFRTGRRAGVTIRSSVDCLIAACAIRGGHEVLHLDRDYTALAQVTSLRARSVR